MSNQGPECKGQRRLAAARGGLHGTDLQSRYEGASLPLKTEDLKGRMKSKG